LVELSQGIMLVLFLPLGGILDTTISHSINFVYFGSPCFKNNKSDTINYVLPYV